MQLVELQRTVHEVHGDDIAVLALSRDTVDVVATFAKAKGITYPLLADVDAVVIEDLGLLNEHIETDQEFWGFGFAEERHGRLPYPGTFLLDEEGVLTDKRMERDYKSRRSGGTILADLGLPAQAPTDAAVVAGPGVRVTGWTDADAYFPHQRGLIRLAIEVEDGYHLYVPPNPDGYTDLDVQITGPEGLETEAAELPAGEPFRIDGLDEDFTVVEGPIDLDIGFMLREGTGTTTIGIDVAFQACSDRDCLIPSRVHLDLAVDERARV